MKVLKFGGSSMATSQSILQVKSIIENNDTTTAVVVSALGGITDMLINASQTASQGGDYQPILQQIKDRHTEVTNGLFGNPQEINNKTSEVFEHIANLLHGVALLKELSHKTSDAIVGQGELLSSMILHHLINDSQWYDSRQLIVTSRNNGRNKVIWNRTEPLIAGISKNIGKINIFPGFVASDEAGMASTLGRGGSDYTAALLARGLGADILEIYTDVDGFMTADPKVISRAYTIEHITYAEAMELSHFGAKVIYPPTIMPVYKSGIPIRIKNTFKPHLPGTLIDAIPNGSPESHIKGISSIQNMSLLTVQGPGMVGVTGIASRLFTAMANNDINVVLISQASSENSISFAVENAEAEIAKGVIEKQFAAEIASGHILPISEEKEMAVVAIVGERMKQSVGVAAKMFNAIAMNGVNIYAIAQGASELNISVVVKSQNLKKTLNSLHDSFFLSHYKVLHLFMAGVGTVGSKLLSKLEKQAEKLRNNDRLVIRIAGVTNSRSMIFDPQGINPAEIHNLLKDGSPSSPEKFGDMIKKLNLSNSVFVDCTANPNVASIYQTLLSESINVVTANKIASSSKYDHYRLLKDTARNRGVKFLFETNVGAALPIISPINDLLKSGDRIVKLEAVLSGTLNFIANRLYEGAALSEAIEEAREKGFSEPDPRIDLSGTDVARKILILARESGYKLEFDQVDVEPFIPKSFFTDENIDSFMEKTQLLDAEYDATGKELKQKGEKMRYVATLEDGKATVGIKHIDQSHPFFHLEGSNNVVLIWSHNYNEHPMQIKGYGAGADVTASGVFADIIKVANL